MISPGDEQAQTSQDPRPKNRSLVIAVDGPAGAGKSTVAQRVAESLGYLYIDTGAMYRAATWLVIDRNINPQDFEAIANLVVASEIDLKPSDSTSDGRIRVFANGKEITTEIRCLPVTRLVSPISAIPAVREHLVKQQQKLAAHGDVVLDGRDIGTVVLPNADIKIFLTASPEVRAQRRLKDLEAIGEHGSLQSVLADIQARDRQDSTRLVAPLRQATDAIAIHTDDLTVEAIVDKIVKLCQRNLKDRQDPDHPRSHGSPTASR